MDDRVDVMLADDICDEFRITGLADDQRHALGNRPIKTGGKIVEYGHALTRIAQRVDHMAADIAGAAGDQNRHGARS